MALRLIIERDLITAMLLCRLAKMNHLIFKASISDDTTTITDIIDSTVYNATMKIDCPRYDCIDRICDRKSSPWYGGITISGNIVVTGDLNIDNITTIGGSIITGNVQGGYNSLVTGTTNIEDATIGNYHNTIINCNNNNVGGMIVTGTTNITGIIQL